MKLSASRRELNKSLIDCLLQQLVFMNIAVYL